MDWLKNLRAPKFYRYFFYRQYVFSKGLGNIQPAFSAMLLIGVTIIFHLFFILLACGAILNIDIWGSFVYNTGVPIILGFCFIAFTISYFLFYYNDKWSYIVKEFEDETIKQRKSGKYLLLLYLFVSLIVMLRVMLWFIELTSPHTVR